MRSIKIEIKPVVMFQSSIESSAPIAAQLPLLAWKINSSPPEQNSPHFADGIFSSIFVYETFDILIVISLKFVRKFPFDNK